MEQYIGLFEGEHEELGYALKNYFRLRLLSRAEGIGPILSISG
jgi:hypothetical protein